MKIAGFTVVGKDEKICYTDIPEDKSILCDNILKNVTATITYKEFSELFNHYITDFHGFFTFFSAAMVESIEGEHVFKIVDIVEVHE